MAWRWKGSLGAIVVAAFIASCSGSNSAGTTGDASTGDDGRPPKIDGGERDSDAAETRPCSGADACGTGTGCKVAADCKSLVCEDGVCEAPSPTDGVKNDSETDVDCGGGISPTTDGASACAEGRACNVGSDCTSTSCQGGKCVPPTCTDTIKDGKETGVDCGGPVCMGCPASDKCILPTDCQSLVCTSGICQPPTDTDHVRNDSETAVDCGGGLLANGKTNPASDGAPVCATGQTCAIGADCMEGVCALSTCQPATDTDGVKNDSETDVDCGGALLLDGTSNTASDGAAACGATKACRLPSDCQSLVCTNDVCQSPSATDHIKNDSETDVDCGGSNSPTTDGAPACPDGKSCLVGTDCMDLVCATGPVTTPSVDGAPIDCPAGQTCTCQAPTFADGVENDSETDIDCGGALLASGSASSASDKAPTCAVGKKCLLGSDCVEGVCNATAGAGDGPTNCPAGDECVCQAASPTDGVKNDSETGIDCGGGFVSGGGVNAASDGAPVCAVGGGCLLGTDCSAGVCNANAGAGGGPINCPAGDACVCQAPSPTDGVKNDSETDVDCGGRSSPTTDHAPGCADDLKCNVDSDCLSTYCSVLVHTCVAAPSCAGLVTPATILQLASCAGGCPAGSTCNPDTSSCVKTTTPVTPDRGLDTHDAVGTADPNGSGQHAGIDTCGKGESTDATGQVHESCCRSLVIPTNVLPGGDAAGARLDKYEVTAGRMRQFVESVSAADAPVSGVEYDVRDWMQVQVTAGTPIGARFAAQIPAGTTVAAILSLMPADWYSDFNIVASLGGTTMDPGHPSGSQGCYVADSANVNGASTYWWPGVTNQNVSPVVVGEDVVGSDARVFTQDYYDVKSMNCAPYWMYAAFCAWDGGHVASLAEIDAVYGKQPYPWDAPGTATFLPAAYTYTTVTTIVAGKMVSHYYQSFVPGTEYYTGAILAGTAGYNAVDLTVNWNNDSYAGNPGLFYFYPSGGGNPTDAPGSVGSGYDYSPFIAAPGRFYLDRTYINSPSGAGTEGWQDLGANMLEMTDTLESGTSVFCDCSTGGQAMAATGCTTYSCPNTSPTTWPIPRNGGTALPSVRWEGGSWEGHNGADPSTPPYFSDSDFTEPLQTQYGKAGFRCARAAE
jgi:hypothetical protein